MNQTREDSTPLLLPEPTMALNEALFPKYAIINATLKKGYDYVAWVFVSERYGVPISPPEYWQLYRMGDSGGPRTIELCPDCFYRARLSGEHFGIYIDTEGRINCLPERVFIRELNRRFRDGKTGVDLSWDENDCFDDRFSRHVPERNLGEAPFVL